MPSPVFIRIGASRARGGIFARLLAGLFTVLTLIGLLMFSAVAVAVLLLGGAVFLGYLWWKTRALRRALREQAAMSSAQQAFRARNPANDADGMVIEGELIREVPEHEPPRSAT